MKIEIVERNYRASQKLKDILEKKLARFEKYLDDNASAKAVLSDVKGRFKLEITIISAGKYVRTEVETDNMYANVDLALAKLERQIVKYSAKLTARRRKIEPELLMFYDELPKFEAPKITKRKKYELDPMTEDEAIEQMELVGNDFFVFNNKQTKNICILYRRHNSENEYGIIETE